MASLQQRNCPRLTVCRTCPLRTGAGTEGESRGPLAGLPVARKQCHQRHGHQEKERAPAPACLGTVAPGADEGLDSGRTQNVLFQIEGRANDRVGEWLATGTRMSLPRSKRKLHIPQRVRDRRCENLSVAPEFSHQDPTKPPSSVATSSTRPPARVPSAWSKTSALPTFFQRSTSGL